MRIQQFKILKKMKGHFKRFFMSYEQTTMIADFTERIAESFHEENTAENLLQQSDTLREEFRNMPLPTTREKFENRAMLFQFLNDLEQFLIVKNEFKRKFINN